MIERPLGSPALAISEPVGHPTRPNPNEGRAGAAGAPPLGRAWLDVVSVAELLLGEVRPDRIRGERGLERGNRLGNLCHGCFSRHIGDR
jgi:hypothetical protein